MADKHVITSKSKERLQNTTKGQKLKVLLNDSVDTWTPLKDLNECNPVEIADFSKTRCLQSETVGWYVPYVLRKRYSIISIVTSSARKTTHKYGVDMCIRVEHAKRLNANNSNNFWIKAIKKEMHVIGIEFEIIDETHRFRQGIKSSQATQCLM